MHFSPSERDPVKFADWAELEVLYSGREPLPPEAMRSQIEIDGTLTETEQEENHELDLTSGLSQDVSERLVESAIREMKHRAIIMRDAYPYELTGGNLALRSSVRTWTPYTFCLLVSDRQYYDQADQSGERLFEHLCTVAIQTYLGGEAVRFGSPRDTLPQGIHDALNKLAELTQEKKISDGYPVNATDKDLGLDVAGWKGFEDQRTSKVQIYMQCATGDNWKVKKGELNIKTWGQIFSWPNEPVLAMAIPYVAPDGDDWTRFTTGILLMDRLRIANVLHRKRLPGSEFHWADWCRKRLRLVAKERAS